MMHGGPVQPCINGDRDRLHDGTEGGERRLADQRVGVDDRDRQLRVTAELATQVGRRRGGAKAVAVDDDLPVLVALLVQRAHLVHLWARGKEGGSDVGGRTGRSHSRWPVEDRQRRGGDLVEHVHIRVVCAGLDVEGRVWKGEGKGGGE